MLHIYRQITALQRWRPVVICEKRENAERFPFEPLIQLPRALTRALRRLVMKQVLGRPIQIYPWEARRILSEIQRINGRVLHIYFGRVAVRLLPLLRRSPVPVLVSFHGADTMVDFQKPANRPAIMEMISLVELVLVRSESLAKRLVALGCPKQKIRIHRTGIPLGRFHYIPRIAPADGGWRFIQACRLVQKKGLPSSMRAFARFAEKHPLAQFTVAGDGPMLDELVKLAADLGIAEKMIFTGFLSQNALREQMYAAHVFLHPSELGVDGNQEGVPNSMLEAMSTGLPVLATRHGGIPEAVEDAVSGFLVAERDHEALAQKMFELASDPKRYAAMGTAAARAVAERFEQSKQIQVLERCYDEAVAISRSGDIY